MVFFFKTKGANLSSSSVPPENKVTVPGPLTTSATKHCGTTEENSGAQRRISESPKKIKNSSKRDKKKAFLAMDPKHCGERVPYVSDGIDSRGWNIKSSTPPANNVTVPGPLASSATKYCDTTRGNSGAQQRISESPTKIKKLSKTGQNEAFLAKDPKYCGVLYVSPGIYSHGWKIKKWLKIKQRNKSTNTGNELDIHIMVWKKGTKYRSLFRSMSANVVNLNQGYRCLELFRKAEKAAKSKKEMSCAKGYVIGRVKFVMRNQFYGFKQLKEDMITPLRFASIVTLAADSLFRRKLLYDFMKKDLAALKYAHQMIKNPFADKHGFGADKVPDTVEAMKLFYYYLTMTIGVHALMDIRPHICMAIAKWRFYGKHPTRLRLYNNVLSIDEVYASCLRALWTSSYETSTNASTMSCNPLDFIKNKSLLREILNEFEFLKTYASSPTQLAM